MTGTAKTPQLNAPAPATAAPAPISAKRRRRKSALRRLLSNPTSLPGIIILILLVLTAIFADQIGGDPYSIVPRNSLLPPSLEHPAGTDQFGRDLATRLVFGSRVSLRVSFVSISLAVTFGTLLGLWVGYYEGWIDQIVMRLIDIMFAFPVILLVLVIVTILGPAERNLILAIAIIYVPSFVRVVRASVLTIKRREYVEAARAVGTPTGRLLLQHVLPNAAAPIVVQTTYALSTAILTETALNFLGLGTPPPAPSWGGMLSEGRPFLEIAPWLGLFSGLAIMLAVLAFNLVGDGLRDVLDPRLNE